MSTDPDQHASELAGESGNGLFLEVYGELHRLAQRVMAHQRGSHTLQPTALVNEAFLKLRAQDQGAVVDRTHFLRTSARAMRQILVDHARRKNAQKRSSTGERVELDGLVEEYERRSGDLVRLELALEHLEQRDPDLVRMVEMRFFVGHTVEESAAILGISPREAARRWQTARLILKAKLNE